MNVYFAIVKAKVWHEDSADFLEEVVVFKATDESDLGSQLKEYYDNTLSEYSVKWIGDGCDCLYINADIAKQIEELN